MRFRVALLIAALVFTLGTMLFPVLYALFPHHLDRRPSTFGPPIAGQVKMLAKQDPSDARVIDITFVNKTAKEVRLVNEVGGLIELFRFQVTDAQGHAAPFTPLGKKIDDNYHTWHDVDELQGKRIAPGNSITYRFNLPALVDLSQLAGSHYTLTVTFTPLENYSGTVTTVTTLTAPKVAFKTPPANVEQYPAR